MGDLHVPSALPARKCEPVQESWVLVFFPSPTRMSRYPSHLSPNITPTKPTKSQKSRARREPSGVFSLFQPQQIQQFKEAFSLIDQDRDGLVGERDLKDTFASLGTQSHAKCRIDVLIPFVKRHLAVARDDGGVTHVTPRGRRRTVVFR